MAIQQVTTGIIAEGAVTVADVADSTITGAKLAANTLANSVFQTGSIENYLNSQSLNLGMRNRVINGAMMIDQRTVGSVVTAHNSFPVDRFIMSFSNDGAFSGQKSSTAPNGFVNSLKFTVTTADSSLAADQYLFLRHKIEGYNIADLMWGTANAKSVTLSFWVRSSVTGTYCINLRNASDRMYIAEYTIVATDTWEKKIITIAGDTTGTWLTTNGAGIEIRWTLGVGTDYQGTTGWTTGNDFGTSSQTNLATTLNSTFYLTGVQLEVGSQATPFEYRQYGQELALCQRYCYSVGGDDANQMLSTFTGVSRGSGTFFINVSTPVPLRASPSFTVANSGTVRLTYAGTEVNSSANSSTVGGSSMTINFGSAVVNRSMILINYDTPSGITPGGGRADVGMTFNYGSFIFSSEL